MSPTNAQSTRNGGYRRGHDNPPDGRAVGPEATARPEAHEPRPSHDTRTLRAHTRDQARGGGQRWPRQRRWQRHQLRNPSNGGPAQHNLGVFLEGPPLETSSARFSRDPPQSLHAEATELPKGARFNKSRPALSPLHRNTAAAAGAQRKAFAQRAGQTQSGQYTFQEHVGITAGASGKRRNAPLRSTESTSSLRCAPR